jgi:hypothetical protein
MATLIESEAILKAADAMSKAAKEVKAAATEMRQATDFQQKVLIDFMTGLEALVERVRGGSNNN